MNLHFIDWAVIVAYLIFALAVGIHLRRRASANMEQYFLSGRTLGWWLTGTSMIATSFAADTPLVITGWVRDFGLWKNWLWWSYAVSGALWVFLFAKWWRRSGLMTKAEFVELRYGGREASVLRGFLGIIHATVTNTIVLCWVLLAASKILETLFGVDKWLSVTLACAFAMTYSFLAGFWGVVVTDFVQFIISVIGAVVLAFLCWEAVGGGTGILEAVDSGVIASEKLSLFPESGGGSFWEPRFWTTPLVAVAVYLGVYWWAVENVDGSGIAVQRISASRNEKHGTLAVLWFNFGHYALRPWPWIMVALASLIILPKEEVFAPEVGQSAQVSSVNVEGDSPHIVLMDEGGSHRVDLRTQTAQEDWWAEKVQVEEGDSVKTGALLARSDSEKAYVVMLTRFLPMGLLGLVVVSLLAAFMSTIDTHVNLAASFFVNDVYRRFLRPEGSESSYVWVARFASIVIMGMAGVLAWNADSISDLFQFFLAFLAGVGPVYLMRWMWWRVTARTEIVAVLTSGITASAFTLLNQSERLNFALGPFMDDGMIIPEGRIIVIVTLSTLAALLSIAISKTPSPESLVPFFRKVRPIGAWGPVRRLAGDLPQDIRMAMALFGSFGALVMIFGFLFGVGGLLLKREEAGMMALFASVAGMVICRYAWYRQGSPTQEETRHDLGA